LAVTPNSDSTGGARAGGLTLRRLNPRPERQPGRRRSAPGDLALVQAFVNSFWNLERDGEERLASPKALAGWLAERGLIESGARLSRAELRRALDLREGLRALLFANNGAPTDRDAIGRANRALRRPALFVQLDHSAPPDFVASRRDLDGALALVATIVALAQLDGRWSRLKACRGEHCGWAFYDHSRNQTGSWCAMSVCGSRSKARHYRRRKRRSHASSA
jgi:predicted RNA-binding Zn ribbon-like protein